MKVFTLSLSLSLSLVAGVVLSCEHEEDADLESQLDTCEEELCSDETNNTRALCIGIRFDRRALDHQSVVPDEGKMRRVPISMLIIYKEQLHDYYCFGEMKDRVERFDGVIYDDSELPAPKDPESPNDTGKPSGANASSSSYVDKKIACQEEAERKANGADRLPAFKHPSGFNCNLCTLDEGGWDCAAD